MKNDNQSETSSVSLRAADRFYNAIWRWHFYAGMLVMPVLVVLAVTGSIYLFKPQLDPWMYSELMVVTPESQQVSYQNQLDAVLMAYPDAKVSKVIPPLAEDRSTEFLIKDNRYGNLSVFVDPYLGQVLGSMPTDSMFQEIIRDIHGELLIGKTGDYLVEIAASWAVILVFSGFYLWWPRGQGAWKRVFWPGFNTNNRRVFWRNVHMLVGSYTGILIVFLVLSGLPWAGYWGDRYAKVWNQYPAALWDDVPQSGQLTKVLNSEQQLVPWTAEEMPLPASLPQDKTALPLDAVIHFAEQEGFASGYQVSLPKGEIGVYTVSVFPDDPWQQRTSHLDQYSGVVLADLGWHDYPLIPKAVELGIAIHMGRYFGLGNQLLMLSVCVAILLLAASSLMVWWQRRPSGFSLSPPPGKVKRASIFVLMLLAAAIFPLAGASMLMVLLIDVLLISRIKLLRLVLS